MSAGGRLRALLLVLWLPAALPALLPTTAWGSERGETTMPDDRQVANAVARYFAAVDARDWDGVMGLMTPTFRLDYSSFGGGPAAELSPAAIVGAWKGLLPGFEHTHHQIGNLDITVEGDRARVACYGTASHVIGARVWTVVGRYEKTLVRGAAGWRVSGSRFVFGYQTGDTTLPAEAQKRAAGG